MQVSVNKADLAAVQTMLVGIKDGYPRVMRNALNRTVTTTITSASAKIREDLNVYDSTVKEDFAKKTVNATLASLKAAAVASGKPVKLWNFIGTTVLASSGYISIKVKKSGSRYKFKHAFVSIMKSGHVGVFERLGWRKYHVPGTTYPSSWPWQKYFKKMGWSNKIVELTGPRIEDEYSKMHVLTPVYEGAGSVLVHYIDQQLTVELNRLK